MIFSPHADLHWEAAMLAINHTESFFNEILSSIGENKFSEFLKIKIDNETLAKAGTVSCTASFISIDSKLFFILSNIFIFFILIKY